MALNVQPSILKTKTGHLPESANSLGNDDFRELNLFAEAATSAASNNGNYSNNNNSYHTPSKRKKQDPKTGKGLRHFSMKVSLICLYVLIFISIFIHLNLYLKGM